MSEIKAAPPFHAKLIPMWKSSETAPRNVELELAVIDADGVHALVFPCRRAAHGWIDARNGRLLAAEPTHWQLWRHRALTASSA
jgi:hypothetical protein